MFILQDVASFSSWDYESSSIDDSCSHHSSSSRCCCRADRKCKWHASLVAKDDDHSASESSLSYNFVTSCWMEWRSFFGACLCSDPPTSTVEDDAKKGNDLLLGMLRLNADYMHRQVARCSDWLGHWRIKQVFVDDICLWPAGGTSVESMLQSDIWLFIHFNWGENGQHGLSWKTMGVNLLTHGKRP
jgi:hypothetical protein